MITSWHQLTGTFNQLRIPKDIPRNLIDQIYHSIKVRGRLIRNVGKRRCDERCRVPWRLNRGVDIRFFHFEFTSVDLVFRMAQNAVSSLT
jgi:hypothetical protein